MASGNFNLQSCNNSHKFSHLETFCTNCANKIQWKPLLPKQLKCISEETYWTINFSRFRSKFLLIRTLQKKYRIDRCANGQIAKVQYIGKSQISMQNTNGIVANLLSATAYCQIVEMQYHKLLKWELYLKWPI